MEYYTKIIHIMKGVTKEPHRFIDLYPLSPRELVLYPVIIRRMVPELAGMRETGIQLLLDLAGASGISAGAVRTALSRLKATGYVVPLTDSDGTRRYSFNQAKMGLISAHLSRNLKQDGFIVAVYSFSREDEAERSALRETLKDFGFRKLAQNTYINGWIDTAGLLSVVRSMGLERYLYLFPCREIDDPNLLGKIAELFDIPGRIVRLRKFRDDYFSFVGEQDLAEVERGRRMFYAGAVFWNVCMMEEPSIPARCLDEEYPLSGLLRENDVFFAANRESFFAYYRNLNG
ncbi:MAG: hypothetical protein BWY39_00010 [Spirochaetes bacterium ADurb.Bin269]|nr:MAG: hypothetical protein BWY39_00010 [Spirochaetes bacterium ADurb.Bin269]